MARSDRYADAITLTGSALPFVLIGPAGRHRRVLVKSVDDNLDLVGLDGLPDDLTRDQSHGPSFLLNFGDTGRGQRNIVRSKEDVTAGPYDDRQTFYSFAWRGFATNADQDKVREQLDRIAVDLEIALDSGSIDDVEFVLSSVVLICERLHERRRNMRIRFRNLVALTALTYAAIALILLSLKR